MATLLGETVRWPNPLLMKMVTRETESFRSAKVSYLLVAAGVDVRRALQLGDELSSSPGLIGEQQIMDLIREETQGSAPSR